MRLTFLGTGTSQGVPVIGCTCRVCQSPDLRDKRLRTSAMIEVDGQVLVIDTGPDFRQQMLRANPPMVDAVLFTHEHKDHIAGLDDIRAYNFISKKPAAIYATARVQAALRREYHYAFSDEKYPGIPEFDLFEIFEDHPFQIGKTHITPIKVMHYHLPVLGFRIRNMAYITDAKSIEKSEIEKLKNLDVLVLNALRIESHISHFNLQEALDLVAYLKPKRAYFTHISHLLGRHAEVSVKLPQGVFLAEDGMAVEEG